MNRIGRRTIMCVPLIEAVALCFCAGGRCSIVGH
jgi:hypothetical protein